MKKHLKSTTVLALIMFASKIIAFLRDIMLTNCYGASYISDAFLVSISIPTVLFSGVMTALFTCYIPFYKELKENNPDRIIQFNSNLITIVFGVSILFLFIFWIFDDFILKIFAVGFDGKTFQLAKEMANIMAIVMVFMGITYVFQGFLQANESFYLIGAMTIPTNVIIALSIFYSNEENLLIMAWGTVLAYAIYIPYFGLPSYKKGFRYKMYLNFKDDDIKRMMWMVLPIFVGQIVFEINSIVDKSVASMLPAGGVTGLDYSFKVVSMIHSSIVAPISTIVYPQFSQYVVEHKEEQLKQLLSKVLCIVELLVIPLVGGIVVLAKPVIEILFFRGGFSTDAVILTSESLIAYSFSVIPISLRIICEKVFYARQESKIPMLNSMGGIIGNIILDITLVRTLAHVGLALATTVSSFVTLFLFLISLRKRIGNFEGVMIAKTGAKAGIATVAMCIVLYIMNSYLNGVSNIILVIIDLFFGVIVYGALIILMRENIMYEFIKTKTRRKK